MLEKQFAGEKYINKCIAEYLPGKTYKQISDKRCGLKRTNQQVRLQPKRSRASTEQEGIPGVRRFKPGDSNG